MHILFNYVSCFIVPDSPFTGRSSTIVTPTQHAYKRCMWDHVDFQPWIKVALSRRVGLRPGFVIFTTTNDLCACGALREKDGNIFYDIVLEKKQRDALCMNFKFEKSTWFIKWFLLTWQSYISSEGNKGICLFGYLK